MNEKKYIGSVLFYKHLILSVNFLVIILAMVLSIRLYLANHRISEEMQKSYDEIELLQEKLAHLENLGDVVIIEETELKLNSSVQNESWKLVLVNGENSIESDFQVELVTIAGGEKVDQRIKAPLEKMLEAMRAQGMNPIVCSGYRTIEKQASLFEECINLKLKKGIDYTTAFFETRQRQALPGTSEHHTGLAVDIVGKGHQSLDYSQENTKEAKWLAEHCAEYGFILRYPKDKMSVTGVEYESWHFRYVGEDAAKYIMENKITLEEYLKSD